MATPIHQTRPFRLRSRGRLIAATVLLQALVIGAGWFTILQLTRAGISQRVYEAMLDQNSRNLSQFHLQLAREVSGPFEFGSPQWARAQALVESFKPAGGVRLFLLDENERVLCHPAIRDNPNLRRIDYRDQTITLRDRSGTTTFGSLRPREVTLGIADFLSGPVALAVIQDPALGVKIVVHQPEGSVLAAGRRMAEGVLVWGVPLALAILALTAGGSYLLVRRYDGVLERVNRLLEREVHRRTRRGLAIRDALIFGLAKLADYRDTDTGRHLERICRYCEILAEDLRPTHPQITPEWVQRLKLASSMHDIGKVGIPDAILLKPGALNARERSLMELHPVIGAETLLAIRSRVGADALIDMGVQVALEHHERWDGSGYPNRLAGEQISLAARIVALADIYDALTSRRVYKEAMSHEKARGIILSSRASHLDPLVVDAFERRQSQFDSVRAEFQSEGPPERPLLAHAVELARQAAA